MVYVLVDKAGNISRVSKPMSVVVALGAMPANLKLPEVPLAADDLIDRLDAKQGVQVHVLEYDNWKSTDEISVSWGRRHSKCDLLEKGRISLWSLASTQRC